MGERDSNITGRRPERRSLTAAEVAVIARREADAAVAAIPPDPVPEPGDPGSTTLTGEVEGTGVGTVPTMLSAAIKAFLLARANHTGTQSAGTITGLAAVATSGAKADVGLGNVDNTSDANKPVSTAQAAANTADRDRANHTGTQLAATISDFASTVLSTVLTGLAAGTNVVISATDTLLVALAKLQAQVTARALATRAINTTAPLTGGGNLTADRTLAISAATTSAAGSMSAADKTKLDGVTSGTYTPTLVNVANIASVSVEAAQWLRIGNVVTVSLRLLVTPTAGANTYTAIRVTLPVASPNFTLGGQVTGAASLVVGSEIGPGFVQGNVANKQALVAAYAPQAAASSMNATFTYLIVP